MKKDTLVVGDLHGRHEIVETVLKMGYNVIFIGDYLDSFNRTVKDQVYTLNLVLNACEAEPERVQALMGNHELSYLERHMMCSGYNAATAAHIIYMKDRMHKLLKEYVWLETDLESILLTHAGLTRQLVPDIMFEHAEGDVVEAVKYFLDSQQYQETKYNIGSARGGWSEKPGIFWCDWWDEFEPIEGLTQITGHTSYRPQRFEGVSGIINDGKGNWNIDCLDSREDVLFIRANGEISKMELY